MKNLTFFIGISAIIVSLNTCQSPGKTQSETWRFVSMPDFLNVDCDFPQEGWEEALSFILESVKNEKPDFLVVPGDLVMGHWDHPEWSDADTIDKYANRYYSAWKNRMAHHDLKYYTAIGDHEVGDNPWRDDKKMAAVKLYKQAFAEHLQMPQNGPEHMRGTAFWWRHKNVLFVSVDVFESGESNQGLIKAGVTGEQLNWLNRILEEQADAKHKIVMGHTPILGPVRSWSSSKLMIDEGRESEFWQSMKRQGVDAYLCGEVHAITCTERDGIVQVAHGGLIGYNTRTNYMLVTVSEGNIELEIKEIEMLPSGDHLWQTKKNRPLQRVEITEASKVSGFHLVGKATIDKTGGKQFLNRQGYFLPEHESSDARAVPVFRKDNPRGLPTELPKIRISP